MQGVTQQKLKEVIQPVPCRASSDKNQFE